MFHAFDSHPVDRPADRAQWMALLARAPMALLEPALGPHALCAPRWLRPPETGLMMVQGRVGGTGERFNLGEVTVTRCALRLPDRRYEQAAVGVAYVLGRSHRQAQLAAVADALLQEPEQQALLDASLLEPVRAHLARERARRHARAQTSKVEFFTVARETGSARDEEGDE
ncbi:MULTISPECIES: phosphonate C-P lyase system protein PhnG [unclassified Variovorax]|jgi:alpha-D-ribose 1-methylphosphonate 5-triphosphate synthase subunit PhnG|uniref:phosphonate C-P lyase system protein PhnG n=1 Tax=unclassified Variovorax TaxID=663243 RepID=UPI002B23AB11|nr:MULTISPECIES: phosphonate C-P lyase system protein PhnG [unclassified Variovorax]MEB0059988.1 phosphonate C-P lyase system protein PhnG [Variovorax sp. LG9.2]MEB0112625.1 phosphonate C-P lyase system protein PhnG [Variovorax sp. RTB1]